MRLSRKRQHETINIYLFYATQIISLKHTLISSWLSQYFDFPWPKSFIAVYITCWISNLNSYSKFIEHERKFSEKRTNMKLVIFLISVNCCLYLASSGVIVQVSSFNLILVQFKVWWFWFRNSFAFTKKKRDFVFVVFQNKTKNFTWNISN